MDLKSVIFFLLSYLVNISVSFLSESGNMFIEERYICGGHSGIYIASGTNLRVTPSSEDLSEAYWVLIRKTRWIAKHTRSIIKEFRSTQRILENHPEFTEVPDCLHQFNVGDSTNLRTHLEILSEVTVVLDRMKEEEEAHDYGYMSHRITTIQSSVEHLMCQLYIIMGMRGLPLPSRTMVTSTSKWCTASCAASRYERDNFLLNRIKLLIDNLYQKYRQNIDNSDDLYPSE